MSTEARELAQRFGVRMCDENGMTHGEELYCFGLDDIIAMKEALAKQEQGEPVALRRGDILRCIETDELCTVWATSTTGKTLVKWGGNDFGDYTAEQIGELFWVEPRAKDLEDAAERSDNYAAFYAGVRYAYTHPQPKQEQEQEQEQGQPVAWKLMPKNATNAMLKAMDECSTEGYDERLYAGHASSVYTAAWDALDTTPQQRTWVGLTNDECVEIAARGYQRWLEFAQAIEAKLKEKNT